MSKLILSLCLVSIIFTAKSQDYVITKMGVGTDSTKLSTQAIQTVIDKAHESGGGTIVIPKGVFLTGA
jgi:polygalacturonase